jgi:amino acid transporter
MKGGDNVNTTLKKILATITTLALAFTLASPALLVSQVSAQGEDPETLFGLGDLQDKTGLPGEGSESADSVRTVVGQVIKLILSFLGIIAIIIILYAGFIWMTAAGNEEKVSTARATLTAGLIGLAIIIVAYILTSFVINALFDLANNESILDQ